MSSTAEQFVSDLNMQDYVLPTEEHKNMFGQTITGTGLGSKIMNALTGVDHEQDYQNMLTNKEREYELAKLNDARAYETWYDSTKYQRAVADLKAAGLNPWLALQSGVSGSGSSSVGVTSSAKSKMASKGSSKGTTVAALAIAAAKILAMLV